MGTHWNVLRQWVHFFLLHFKNNFDYLICEGSKGGQVEKQRDWFESYGRNQTRDDLVGMRVIAMDPGRTLSFGADQGGLDDCCCSVAKSGSILCDPMKSCSVMPYPSSSPGDDDRLQTQSRACSFTQWFSCFQDPMCCLFFQKIILDPFNQSNSSSCPGKILKSSICALTLLCLLLQWSL